MRTCRIARRVAPLALVAWLAACGRGGSASSAASEESAPPDVDLTSDVGVAQPTAESPTIAPAARLAVAQAGPPEDVVRLLFEWDTAGLRFEGPYADALSRLYCFEPEQNCRSDEPAWEFALIVDGYQLDPVLEGEDSAQYVVTFDEIGAAWPDSLADPLGTPPDTLSLKRMDGRWRIVAFSPELPPHLSPNGLLHRYRGLTPDSVVIARWLRDRED